MSSPETCPCCGQIIPPKIDLGGQLRILYDAIRSRPRMAWELRDLLWLNRPGGGALNDNTVYSLIYDLNTILKPHGIAVRTSAVRKRSQGEAYRLVAA